MSPDTIEYELGVPIPGQVLPPSQWARTAIKRLPETGPLDCEAIFGRKAPVILDVGCGNGRYTLQSALSRPEFDHVGIDVLPVVIRYATRRANQRGLRNVRFAVKDAATYFKQYVASSTIAEIHLYHPQPYHDRGNAGLRVLTPGFLAVVHGALITSGLFVVQTDNPDYWAYMTTVLPAFFHFQQHPGPWPDAPQGRTRREIISRQRGLAIFRGSGTRRDELRPDDLAALVAVLPLPTFRTRGPWCELDRTESSKPKD